MSLDAKLFRLPAQLMRYRKRGHDDNRFVRAPHNVFGPHQLHRAFAKAAIGAYHRGSNKAVDAAIDMQDELNRYLRQPVEESSTLDDARDRLLELHRQYRERLGE